MKTVFDNDISIRPEQPRIIYYDLEAYDHDYQPAVMIEHVRPSCQIGLLVFVSVYNGVTEKHALVNGEYPILRDSGCKVHKFVNEEALCRFFLKFANETSTVLVGHNSSTNMFSEFGSPGYDMPFLLSRANYANAKLVTKGFTNKSRASKGLRATRIEGLSRILLVDSQELFQEYVRGMKIPIQSLSLNTVAETMCL
jgi:hypothetical protein